MKPGIIVIVSDDSDVFNWMSAGWFDMKSRHKAANRRLFAKAKKAIEAADNVPDAIKRLEEAGFEVTKREG